MKPNFTKIMPLMAITMGLQAAYAGNITNINVSVLPDQQRVIKVKFDRDVKQPTGFVTASPSRIALDFAGTGVQSSQNQLSFNDTLLNQIVVAQNNDNARLLLGLTKEAEYNTQIKGNEIWIYVKESGSNSEPTRATTSTTTASQQFSGDFGLDFHKGANRSGVVEFRAGTDTEPKVKVQSDRVVLTLKNYQISTQDQKNLDVTDFSTPVRTIAARRIGNDTEITVRNQGTWQHRLTPRSGGRYSLTIVPTTNTVSAAAKAAMNDSKKQKKNFNGKHLSLDFQDIEVRTVLQILAKESGINIVASDSVQGKMTLSLKDVPWDQALDLVLSARDLVMEKNGNIINILTNAESKKRRLEDAEDRAKLDDLIPLVSQTFQLKYKNVEELRDVLKLDQRGNDSGTSGSLLTKRGSARVDPATNTLIVKDTSTVIQEFQRLIEELDVPARQVMVETRIVEADVSVGRDLGIKLGYARAGRTGVGNTYNNALNNRNVGVGASTGVIDISPNINLPTVATATTALGLIRSFGSSALSLELSAMEEENRSKTISSPRVLTQDRKEAEIRQGTQIPYQTRDADGSYTTAFKDAVLSMKVTPRITPDNNIILDVTINKDNVDNTRINADGEPAISVKQVKTQAMVENGGTLVVGGVYQEQISNNISKVPLLGDVPVLGNLFKSKSRNHQRSEVLFFITPRIIEGQSNVMRY
ncbi:type IV pilus secretin PilQ [Simonsiella muelleri]|uniref:Type IV pilus biogenesis and competence protein PilQ n=1 Tax=Simonsiella muelleri ATCC 29453 TaxID=641147 RepID=V9H8U6_9NEIS|nr:type IV pilus secretin PilQ [Simonsiella muelleri]AUX62193.1 pilus assembly protein PilQ [Simonsiella muelleri ATCC 29453]EFG31285.1 type IV pilus secretin PilQ [Simonsiella muelleri ATCC 29453]UBQ54288.1 type IV pilus secretin PilQ [Simonsiella muelleri]